MPLIVFFFTYLKVGLFKVLKRLWKCLFSGQNCGMNNNNKKTHKPQLCWVAEHLCQPSWSVMLLAIPCGVKVFKKLLVHIELLSTVVWLLRKASSVRVVFLKWECFPNLLLFTLHIPASLTLWSSELKSSPFVPFLPAQFSN